jgi:membrane protease YdiL (CAAX protease family)
LALALIGPGLVALLSRAAAHGRPTTLAVAAPWLAIFAALTLAVWAIARFGEGLRLSALGFGRVGWLTLPTAAALAAYFIFVFGPAAWWFLVTTHLPSFAGGESTLALLPKWFLVLNVVIVAAGEEWLYRAYAIERLQALVGRPWLAGLIALAAFGLAHLPLWGPGVALTTLVSGGVFTALYLLRRDITALILAHVLTDLYGLVIAPGR